MGDDAKAITSVRVALWKSKGWCVVVDYADRRRIIVKAASRADARDRASKIRIDPQYLHADRVAAE